MKALFCLSQSLDLNYVMNSKNIRARNLINLQQLQYYTDEAWENSHGEISANLVKITEKD